MLHCTCECQTSQLIRRPDVRYKVQSTCSMQHKKEARQSRVADEVDTHPNKEGPWFRRPQVSQFSGQSAITILPTISPNNNGCLEQSVQIHNHPFPGAAKQHGNPGKRAAAMPKKKKTWRNRTTVQRMLTIEIGQWPCCSIADHTTTPGSPFPHVL